MAWAEAVTAISTALIAVILAFAGVALISWVSEVRRLTLELSRLTASLDQDLRPTVQSVRTLVDDASAVVSTVRSEVVGVVETSKGLRRRIDSAADSVEDRLQDLEALLDVVQNEVEDTVLDIAAALRTTRRGGSLIRRMKRALVRRRR
ncbi:MAG: hypothetical protein ACE5HT_07780 [Gemmatimonadales bacterium]